MDTWEMKLSDLKPVFEALSKADVRYLVVGGLAVNVHGLRRYTQDLDLVVQLVPANVERAFQALQSVGYSPAVPVTASQFADRTTREGWIREKGMQVLNFFSDLRRETPVDVFVTDPFQFDEEFERAVVKPLGDVQVRVVSLSTLIDMKKAAGRPQDLIDVDNLELGLRK